MLTDLLIFAESMVVGGVLGYAGARLLGGSWQALVLVLVGSEVAALAAVWRLL